MYRVLSLIEASWKLWMVFLLLFESFCQLFSALFSARLPQLKDFHQVPPQLYSTVLRIPFWENNVLAFQICQQTFRLCAYFFRYKVIVTLNCFIGTHTINF